MIPKTTSPIPIPTVEEQLRFLYKRLSVVNRLIRAMELYQQLKPGRASRKHQVA